MAHFSKKSPYGNAKALKNAISLKNWTLAQDKRQNWNLVVTSWMPSPSGNFGHGNIGGGERSNAMGRYSKQQYIIEHISFNGESIWHCKMKNSDKIYILDFDLRYCNMNYECHTSITEVNNIINAAQTAGKVIVDLW